MYDQRHYLRSIHTTASCEVMENVAGVVSWTTFHNAHNITDSSKAVAFGYLERLLYLGDSGKCYEEEARLRSLSNVLNQAGFQPYLYEDFADELFNIIRSIANAINEGNGDEVLLNAFNDDLIQNYIITHFKVKIFIIFCDTHTHSS